MSNDCVWWSSVIYATEMFYVSADSHPSKQ